MYALGRLQCECYRGHRSVCVRWESSKEVNRLVLTAETTYRSQAVGQGIMRKIEHRLKREQYHDCNHLDSLYQVYFQ